MTRLKPLNDVIFKRIFGVKANKYILIDFLNSILKSQVKDVEIQEEKVTPEKIDDKLGILDIKAILDTGEKVNIEVQLINPHNMIKRTLFYWSRLYLDNFKSGENYNQLVKTITINILGYVEFLNFESFYSSYHIYEDNTYEKLNDDLEIHFIELPKFRNIQQDWHNPLHRWLLFLQGDTKPEDLEEIIKMDEIIRMAEEKLTFLSADAETRRLYELREKQLSDEASRMSGAKEEGIKEGLKKTARNLLGMGHNIKMVSEATGLSEEVIKKLQQEERE